MANIRIDTDGLQNNISSMRAYVNELDSLNARTQSLLAQIASSWEGEASTAYINIMTERMQKAGQMKELLQEFLSYMHRLLHSRKWYRICSHINHKYIH